MPRRPETPARATPSRRSQAGAIVADFCSATWPAFTPPLTVEPGLPAIVGGADIKFRVMGASDNVTFHQEGCDWAADDARRDQADGIAGNAELHRI